MATIEFKALERDDITQLYHWFKHPEVHKWYARSKNWSLADLEQKYIPRIIGQESIPSFIIYLNHQAIGFIQYYPCSSKAMPEGLSIDLAHSLGIKLHSAAGIDLFIGEPSVLGMGYGTKIIHDFIQTKIPASFDRLFVDPLSENARAIKTYLKLGFTAGDYSLNEAFTVLSLQREHMKTILESNRLWLREPHAGEVDKIIDYLKKYKKNNQAFEVRRPEAYYSKRFWQDRIRNRDVLSFDQKGCQLFIFLKEDPSKIIGYVNFDNVVRGCFQACTLGYVLESEHQRRGYMNEALHSSIEYIFSYRNLHRIQANYIKANVKSAKVLAALGFEIEGHAKQYLYINGQWQDHVLTSLINPNWKNH